jgi:MFS family permease
MFYSSNIMGSSGLPPNKITALVGFVNCVSVFPTIYLFGRFGRKILLWTLSLAIAGSLIGLGVCLLVDAQSQIDGLGNIQACQILSVVFLLLFIMFFEFSLGPLLWVYLSEVMTEKGLSLGVGVNQIFTVLIAYFTNSLIAGFGGNHYSDEINQELGTARLFLTCGGITFGCALFCFFIVKETKGLTDKEIQTLYGDHTENISLQKESYLL